MERQEFVQTENLLNIKLKKSEETCVELKTKLRRVEQTNDDLERRERFEFFFFREILSID